MYDAGDGSYGLAQRTWTDIELKGRPAGCAAVAASSGCSCCCASGSPCCYFLSPAYYASLADKVGARQTTTAVTAAAVTKE